MSSCRWRRRPAALAFLAGIVMLTAQEARAQLYFRPFAHTFSHSWREDAPEDDGQEARYGSRRAIRAILAREGFRLVGPLEARGDQVVATGYSRREGEMRFVIDPYAGRIIRGRRLAPAELDRGPGDDDAYVRPLGGSRPVVRDLGRNEAREAEDERPRRRAERARRYAPRNAARPEPAPPPERSQDAPAGDHQTPPASSKAPSPPPPTTWTPPREQTPASNASDGPAGKQSPTAQPPRTHTRIDSPDPVVDSHNAPSPGPAKLEPNPMAPLATKAPAGGGSRRAIVPPTTPKAPGDAPTPGSR